MRISYLLPILLIFTGGCSTVPSDAPKELHQASAAIDKMHEKDMGKIMPKTTKKAENTFDEALDLWKNGETSEARNSSKPKALEAESMAEAISNFGDTVKTWDNNFREYENTVALLYDYNALKQKVDNLRAETESAESPFAMLKDISFNTPVAYFDFDQTAVEDDYAQDISQLSDLMKKDPRLTMALTGYADPRGTADYNAKLAMERAQNVAGKFQDMGVNPSRITVFSGGMVEVPKGKHSLTKYQLDRKVVVSLEYK